jgi:hypothetical protein
VCLSKVHTLLSCRIATLTLGSSHDKYAGNAAYATDQPVSILVKNHVVNGNVLSHARPGAFVSVYQPWFEMSMPAVQGIALLTTLVEPEPGHPKVDSANSAITE